MKWEADQAKVEVQISAFAFKVVHRCVGAASLEHSLNFLIARDGTLVRYLPRPVGATPGRKLGTSEE